LSDPLAETEEISDAVNQPQKTIQIAKEKPGATDSPFVKGDSDVHSGKSKR
jgi:hypothetical protein